MANPATKAKNKYRDKNYARVELAIDRDLKETLDAAAEVAGESRTEYVRQAILMRMANTQVNKTKLYKKLAETY